MDTVQGQIDGVELNVRDGVQQRSVPFRGTGTPPRHGFVGNQPRPFRASGRTNRGSGSAGFGRRESPCAPIDEERVDLRHLPLRIAAQEGFQRMVLEIREEGVVHGAGWYQPPRPRRRATNKKMAAIRRWRPENGFSLRPGLGGLALARGGRLGSNRLDGILEGYNIGLGDAIDLVTDQGHAFKG